MSKKVIDVSAWQGDIDFKKVKNSGIAGVIIRAGYGKGNIDEKFKKYITDANSVGLPVGVYWFSYAYTVDMAKKEAEYCLAAIKPYKISMPVYFDFEYDSMSFANKQGVYPNKTLVTNMYKAFCSTVAAAGYKAGYYSNPDYLTRYINDTTGFSKYSKWLALYASSVGSYKCDLWQYAAVKTVPGINCNVDINELFNESIITAPIVNGKPETPATPVEPSKPNTPSTPTSTFAVGDYVKIKSGAVYYGTTTKIPANILAETWIVASVGSANRVVIDKSVDGKYSIMSAVDAKYLTKVSNTKQGYPGPFPTLPKRGYFIIGDKSAEVKKIQDFLNWVGLKVTVDSIYGINTSAAVKKFQTMAKLAGPDGLYGPNTLNAAKNYKK